MAGNAIKNTLQALVVYVFFLGVSSAMFVLSVVRLTIAGDDYEAIAAFQFAVVAASFILSFLCYKAVSRALEGLQDKESGISDLNTGVQSESGL